MFQKMVGILSFSSTIVNTDSIWEIERALCILYAFRKARGNRDESGYRIVNEFSYPICGRSCTRGATEGGEQRRGNMGKSIEFIYSPEGLHRLDNGMNSVACAVTKSFIHKPRRVDASSISRIYNSTAKNIRASLSLPLCFLTITCPRLFIPTQHELLNTNA